MQAEGLVPSIQYCLQLRSGVIQAFLNETKSYLVQPVLLIELL